MVESKVTIFEARVLRQSALDDDKLGFLAHLMQETHLALSLLESLAFRRVKCYLALVHVFRHWEKFRAKVCQSLFLCIRRFGSGGLFNVVDFDSARE